MDVDALRRENAQLREANHALQEEAKLAREGQALSFEQIRALLALTEKYALQLRQQAEGDVAKTGIAASGGAGGGSSTAPLAHQLLQAATPITPSRLDTSLASQGGATPVVTQQIIHESPPPGGRLQYTEPAATSFPTSLPLACPTKIQRKAQLAGDTWTPKNTEFDPDLVVGVALPSVPAKSRIEPMLLGGKIYKIHSEVGADSAEIAFFNGTRDMQFTLDYTFLEGSVLYPGSEEVSVGQNQLAFSVTVFPGQTKTLVTGRVNGYTMNLRYGYASASCLDSFKPALDTRLSVASGQVRSLCMSSHPAPVGSVPVADLCALGGIGFVDPEFPPSQTSICRIHEKSATLRPWIKLDEAYMGKHDWQVSLFVNGVEPHDIDAGLLGDAWLLSAIAAVAESPVRIHSVFESAYTASSRTTAPQDHRSGIYRLRLCSGGWWTTVVLDSWFPASPLGPAFARSISTAGTLWMGLLEKGFAKLLGSYQALRGQGEPLHALSDITGCGCDYFNWRHPAEAIEQLREAVSGGYIVVLTTPGLDPVGAAEAGEAEESLCTTYQKVGLVTGYSYAVMAAGDTHCVVRNAWGDSALWKGDSDANNGTIDIHYDDLCTLFDSGGVCYAREGQHSLRVQATFSPREGPDVLVAVEAVRECFLCVTLHQQDTRGSEAGEEVAAYGISVVSEAQGGWTQLAASHNGTFWKGRETVLRIALKPSSTPYYVIPRAYREDVSATVVLSLNFEGPSTGTVARFLKPTEGIMESLSFNPIYNFDPSECTPIRPLVQIGKGDPLPSQSVKLTEASLLN